MGEISFRYMRKYEPVYEAVFKYWFADSKEYSFAYQRYIALSDTSIFNDPVAISKVATGFYSLHDLFVDKVIHPTIEQNMISYYKDGKSFTIKDFIIGIHRNIYEISIKDTIFILDRINDDFLTIYKNDILLFKDNSVLNIIDTFNMSTNYKGIIDTNNIVYINKYHLLNIYNYNNLLEKITGTSLNIYHDMYNLRRTNIVNRLKDNVLCRIPIINLEIYSNAILSRDIFNNNIFDNIMTCYDRIVLNKYWNDLAYKPINIANYENTISCTPKYLLQANIIQLLFGYIPTPVGNVIEQIYAKKAYLKTDINKISDFIIDNKYFSLNSILSGTISNKIENAYNILFSKSSEKSSEANYYIISGITDKQHVFQTYQIFTRKPIKTKQMFTDKGYKVIKYQSALCKFDLDTFSIVNEKYAFTFNGIFNLKDMKDIMIQSGTWQINNNRSIFETNDLQHIIKSSENAMLQYESVFCSKYKKDIVLNNKLIFGSKISNNIFTTKSLWISNIVKDMFLNTRNEFIFKVPVSITNQNSGVFINNIPKPIWFINDDVNAINNRKPLKIHDAEVYTYKIPYQIQIYDSGINTIKNKMPIFLYEGNQNLYKKPLVINSFQKDIWTFKNNHELSTFNQLFVDKDKRMLNIFQQSHFLLKKCISSDVADIESVIKNQIPTDVINGIVDQYGGMIIPVSKIKHQAFIDRVDKMISKYLKDSYINLETFASILPKNVHYDEDLFFDKDVHKVFINYKNEMVTKSKIYGYMHNDVFIDKQKENAYIETILNATKESNNTWIEDIDTIQKSFHELTIHQDELLEKNSLEISIPDSLFVDKTDKICYYDYGAFADKSEYRIMLHQDELILRDKKQMHLADLVPQAIKEKTGIFYDYEIFSNRIIKESELYKEIDNVEKLLKEVMLHPDDFGNWAWVYETPDPIDVTYGIDELLLPENDTRYSDFEDIIFNKKTMRPRNPVKVINDTTFIAKYPHKHPIPEYSNIAVNYDDSAVKYEQYFGIETEIMHKVFLKYYRIWQSKIFEFGTMTMVQSVKKMLEYLYAWIMIYFPPDKIEQALRVFKLIRWYGESAIIQNSQYIVSYEYDTLESKLTTGTCAIPNNLGTGNDSMIVDASLGVIKNNPIYADGSQKAYVEFYIDNRKNTSITFSLSNTVGSVNIYINNILVDVISHSTLNMTYQIPYTGDVNVVKIEKPANHNLNKHFYIANIKVPELSFKDLSIEFDATLKMGNKPLDEIAKKMIQYANLYDDFKDAYYKIKRNNLGVQEIYKKMLEYWNLHHQDKTKGKRLTIKEV